MKWRPDLIIERTCRALAAAAGRQIRAASPPVPHRAGRTGVVDPRVGGTLSSQVQARAFVRAAPWGSVLRWASLGIQGLAFVRGTKRQKSRPIQTSPDVPRLVDDLRADAVRHLTARADALGRDA